MTDPIIPSARFVLKQSLEELRAAVEGAPAEALNWRPGVEEVPAAFALLHALEHLGQHVAHCSLTRQLWESR